MKAMFFLAFILPLAYAQPTCPTSPPPVCSDNQMLCPGPPPAADGCPMPGFCLDTFDPYVMDTAGNPCPNHCPLHCGPGDVICHPPATDVCPMPGFCHPAVCPPPPPM